MIFSLFLCEKKNLQKKLPLFLYEKKKLGKKKRIVVSLSSFGEDFIFATRILLHRILIILYYKYQPLSTYKTQSRHIKVFERFSRKLFSKSFLEQSSGQRPEQVRTAVRSFRFLRIDHVQIAVNEARRDKFDLVAERSGAMIGNESGNPREKFDKSSLPVFRFKFKEIVPGRINGIASPVIVVTVVGSCRNKFCTVSIFPFKFIKVKIILIDIILFLTYN